MTPSRSRVTAAGRRLGTMVNERRRHVGTTILALTVSLWSRLRHPDRLAPPAGLPLPTRGEIRRLP